MTESQHPQEPAPVPPEPTQACEAGAEVLDEGRARDEDEASFVDGLLVREEVVPGGSGPLPPGTTHEATGEDDGDGVPRVRRRRFSAH